MPPFWLRLPSPLKALAILALAAGALHALACAAPRLRFRLPDFPRDARAAGPSEEAIALPIFALPRRDLDAGVGILGVFVSRPRPGDVEVTVVFADEDHPWRLVDRAYDLIRWHKFHRIADVETFHYRGDSVDLDDVYAGAQRWDVTVAEHHSGVFPRAAFEERGGRPVVYVNTWNHLFGPRPTNPAIEHVAVADYPVYAGDRRACEALFEAAYGGRAAAGPVAARSVPDTHP